MIGTVIKSIVLLLSHAASGLYSSNLKYSKRLTYLLWGLWVTIQTVFLFIAEFVLVDKFLQFLLGFVVSLIGQYVIFFITTKGKIVQRIFTILTYSVFFCIAMSFFTIVEGTFVDLHWIVIVIIQAIMLCAITTYFLSFVCPLCNAVSKNITKGWMPLIFVNIVFLITIILSSIFPVRLTNVSEHAFFPFLFLSVSIMVVYPVIFSNIKHMSVVAEKRAVETQNKLLLLQIKAESEQLEAYSQARHDLRHHNLVMLEFAKNNDLESLREYLGGLIDNESNLKEEIKYCDNMMINTILRVYGIRAKENGITLNITARVSSELQILPQDLVIVIANLFENAINATTNLKHDNKCIDIYIKDSAQRLLIKVENQCEENLDFDETHYGVGIRSIISTTNKYEGMHDFSVENGIFSAKISLNLM